MLKEHHFDANRLGYDIPLSSQKQQNTTAFRFFHPYFGQNPRSIETLNITTIRAGVALKFGQGRQISTPEDKIAAVVDLELL
jgi:hypothetical protein